MNKIKKIIVPVLVMGILHSSCDKLEDFGSTNQDPNSTTIPSISALLTNVESSLGGYASFTRGGLYCQFFSETQYTDASLYSLPQIAFTGEYSGVLNDAQDIIRRNPGNNQTAVARILKAYIFWTITDRWGDVPYSEALSGNPTPKYDTQETIYKSLISELTQAVAQFDNASAITGDVIYNGDVDSWKRVANSLRMLMALRLSKKYPGANDYAATEFKAALNDPAGYISTNAENFTLDYPGGNFLNPWYDTYLGRSDYAESETMTDLLSTLGDGRINVYGADVNGNPSAVGVPYGLRRDPTVAFTTDNPNWAYVLNPSFRQEGSPVVIVSAAEVFLARAEAADRGWTSENAFNLLKDGVNASFEQWQLSPPSASYFTQSSVAFSAPQGTGANLRQIATQRYVATYPDGLQGWSEWRRTGYPVLTPAPDAINSSKQIPRRYVYGQNEYSTNNANVTEAASRLPGGDTQDSKIWWDQ